MASISLGKSDPDSVEPAGSEEPFAALGAALSHIEDSAVVYSADGTIVVWNQGAEKLFGYTFEEAREREVSFLCPPEESGDTIKLFVRALSGQPVAPRQVERIYKDGTRLRISTRATPLENEEGEIYGVLFVSRDLAPERERAERIDAAERREREIARLVPDALYVHRAGKILWANPAAAQMFEAGSATQLVGRSAWELIHPDDLEEVLESHSRLNKRETSPPIFVRRRRLTGEIFPSEGRGAPILWEDEPATLMVVRDLTDQQRTASALAESEARQRDFAEVSPDAMLVHLDGEIVFVNQAAVDMFGAENREALLGTDVSERLHPDDRRIVVENWDRWRAGIGVEVVEVRRLRMDGSFFHGEGRFRSIYWEGRPAYLVVIRDVSERIAVQAALRESEERHRQIVEVSPDAILIHVHGQIVFANRSAVEMFGASDAGGLVGRRAMELVPDDLQEFTRGRLATIQSEGRAPLVRTRRRRLDGGEFEVEVVGTAYSWEGGPANLTIIRDITQAVAAEKARALLEERYQRILELTPEAIFIHSEGIVRYANPATVRMFGATTPDDLVGRPIMDFVHQDDHGQIHSHREMLEDGREIPMMDVRRVRLDGTSFHTRATGAAIQWEGQQGFIVISRDITDELRAARELQESEERHRTITDTSPDAVVVHVDSRVVFANRSAVEMFGCADAGDLIGQDHRDLIHADDRALFADNEPLRPGESREPIVARRLRSDGEVFQTESTRSGYVWNGQPAILAVVRDITERFEAERQIRERTEELERTNTELERFAYVASHDLKEPLRMVSSFCGLLQERYADALDEQANEFIRFAVDGAKRMQGLIDDLLKISRTGTSELIVEPVDLAGVVSDVEANLAKQIEDAGATICSDTLPTVIGDRTLLVQLFQNLITNAIKFRSDDPPVVEIKAALQGDMCALGVCDNGIGLDPKNHEKVFEVFKTLHARDRFEGNGIGLSVCKKVVERHGGRMWIDSVPGEGASFWFTLPVVSANPRPR